MKKIYYLSTCDTCKRIMKEIGVDENWEKQDIKTDKITKDQLEEMRSLANSYESLFSKRAQKYRSMNLNEQELTEEQYKQYILDEYTFLKRPVLLLNNKIFIGNSKKVTNSIIQELK